MSDETAMSNLSLSLYGLREWALSKPKSLLDDEFWDHLQSIDHDLEALAKEVYIVRSNQSGDETEGGELPSELT